MLRTLPLCIACLLPIACEGQPIDDWEQYKVLKTGELTVQLQIRKSASLATEKWLAFHFDNQGQPVEVRNISYRLAAEGFDAASKSPLYTGSAGQGNGFDLLGEAVPKTDAGWTLPTGSTVVWQHTSDYASALMTERDRDTLIKAKLHFSITMADGRNYRTNESEEPPTATFLWKRWRPDQVAVMRARLRELLNAPPSHHSAGYVVDRLLKVSDVAADISAKELVDAIPKHMDSAFSGRQPILDHLNTHHHNSTQLSNFLHDQLITAQSSHRNSNVQTLLWRLTKVWRDDFLPPLLATYERDPSMRSVILRHLSLHDLPDRDDQALARRLSAVYFQPAPKRSSPSTVRTVENLSVGAADPQFLVMLGRTRDQRLVPYLAPLLRDRRQLPSVALGIPRQRICDVARNAIETILGDAEETVNATPDEALEKLEQRLREHPKFAAAIRPKMKLDTPLRTLVERWKTQRRSVDLLALKPKIKSGMGKETVRDLIGAPIRTEQHDNHETHLYLEPDFRSRVGDYHWLKFGPQGEVIGWREEPWDQRYTPELAPDATDQRFQGKKDYGDWDDVFFVSDRDDIILRKGTHWSRLTLPSTQLTPIGDFPATSTATIKYCITTENDCWLLCESKDSTPFGLELNRGKRVPFTREDANLPAAIQSHIVSPVGSVLLMISGGDKAKWPRDGNRPLYYWLDLRTASVKAMPTGWDANRFAPDLSVVSGALLGKSIGYDMTTGLETTRTTAWPEHVEFNWTNMDQAKPLRRGHDQLSGVSFAGRPYHFRLPILKPHLPRIQCLGDGLALHLRRDADRLRNWALWTSRLEPNMTPELVAKNVQQWHLIAPHQCLFTTKIESDSSSLLEAFVWDANARRMWNVLDDIQDIEGAVSSVQIVPPFGAPTREQRLLCKAQGRMSASEYRTQWRRWIIVGSNASRTSIDEIPGDADGNISQLRFHNAGVLVLSTYQRDETQNPPATRFRLSTLKLAP